MPGGEMAKVCLSVSTTTKVACWTTGKAIKKLMSWENFESKTSASFEAFLLCSSVLLKFCVDGSNNFKTKKVKH